MKKKYEKPTMKLVEWNFQDPICLSICQTSAKCITSETGMVDIKVNNFNGSLDWNDFNTKTGQN